MVGGSCHFQRLLAQSIGQVLQALGGGKLKPGTHGGGQTAAPRLLPTGSNPHGTVHIGQIGRAQHQTIQAHAIVAGKDQIVIFQIQFDLTFKRSGDFRQSHHVGSHQIGIQRAFGTDDAGHLVKQFPNRRLLR